MQSITVLTNQVFIFQSYFTFFLLLRLLHLLNLPTVFEIFQFLAVIVRLDFTLLSLFIKSLNFRNLSANHPLGERFHLLNIWASNFDGQWRCSALLSRMLKNNIELNMVNMLFYPAFQRIWKATRVVKILPYVGLML